MCVDHHNKSSIQIRSYGDTTNPVPDFPSWEKIAFTWKRFLADLDLFRGVNANITQSGKKI